MYNLFFKKLFSFKGRSNRKEYIAKIFTTFAIFVIWNYTADYITNYTVISLIYLFSLVLSMFISLIQYFPLSVRRLHDINVSGWYVFLTFVPFCQFFILWLMFKEGTEGVNRYGEPPKN
jgi:uncharacterized membrane protein YhaH (DUF805 family)